MDAMSTITKKLDTALLANSWGEDRVPEDSPYNHNRKKGK